MFITLEINTTSETINQCMRELNDVTIKKNANIQKIIKVK